jgi:hypothetical protein
MLSKVVVPRICCWFDGWFGFCLRGEKKKRKKVEVPQEKNLIFSILGAKVESRLGWNLYSTVQGPENLRENLIIR